VRAAWHPGGLKEIAWSALGKRVVIFPRRPDIEELFDALHLILSDYSDFKILAMKNLLANIETGEWADGRAFFDSFKGMPALICGAGPSLEREIAEIEKCPLVIACGSAIKLLLDRGVRVDMGVAIDPRSSESDFPKRFDAPLFFQPRVAPHILRRALGPKIFMGLSDLFPLEEALIIEAGGDPFFFDAGWTVGNFGLAVAQALGCTSLYTVGLEHDTREKLYAFSAGTGDLHKRDFAQAKRWSQEFGVTLPLKEFSEKKSPFPLPKNAPLSLFSSPMLLQEELKKLRPFLAGEACKLFEYEALTSPLYHLLLSPLAEVWKHPLSLKSTHEQALFYHKVIDEYSTHFCP
jgi:hypothetical protein